MPKAVFFKGVTLFLSYCLSWLGAAYFVLSFQISELTLEKYSTYLVNRLGIGQTGGI